MLEFSISELEQVNKWVEIYSICWINSFSVPPKLILLIGHFWQEAYLPTFRNLIMAIPRKTYNESQLHLFNGEDENRMYVAYKGIIYDVTDCPKWRHGVHESLHLPGQDLSAELDAEAPHAGGVFSHPCVKIVGRLGSEE